VLVMGRKSDQGGMDYWKNALKSHQKSADEGGLGYWENKRFVTVYPVAILKISL